MVSKMASGKKPVPLDQAPVIEEFTDSQVTCEELCPDDREFFALVRRLGGCTCSAGSRPPLPAGIAVDRRDPHRDSPYVNTLADRRRPEL